MGIWDGAHVGCGRLAAACEQRVQTPTANPPYAVQQYICAAVQQNRSAACQLTPTSSSSSNCSSTSLRAFQRRTMTCRRHGADRDQAQAMHQQLEPSSRPAALHRHHKQSTPGPP